MAFAAPLVSQSHTSTFGENSGVRTASGIDWITYITRNTKATAALLDVADEIRRDHIEPCERVRPFKLGGYEGWQMGALRLGRRDRSCLVQLSGRVSAECWTKMQQCGGSPTRLDVQTTWVLSDSQPSFARRFLRRLNQNSNSPPSLVPRCGYSSDSRGLSLGTVGDRTSNRYLRVYDKGIESRTATSGYIWRTELEAKGGLATALWRDLNAARDVPRWCYTSVCEQWKSSGYSWPAGLYSTRRAGLTAIPTPPPTSVSTAAWLRTSVAPAIERLRTVYTPTQLRLMLSLETDTDHDDRHAPNT